MRILAEREGQKEITFKHNLQGSGGGAEWLLNAVTMQKIKLWDSEQSKCCDSITKLYCMKRHEEVSLKCQTYY